MKKLIITTLFLLIPFVTQGQMNTFQGGTGTTSPSGILYGDSTIRLKTVTIGTGLQFSAGTLTNTGSSTLLQDNNTFSGLNQFTNVGTTTLTGGLDVGGGLRVRGYSQLDINMFASGNAQVGGTLTASNFVGTSTAFNTFVGNVGIGTTAPGYKLDVRGLTAVTANGIQSRVSQFLSTEAAGVGVGAAIALGGETGLASTPREFAFIKGSQNTAGEYGGALSFWTVSSGDGGETNSANYERMRIDKLGNVGIGTTTPWGKLSVTNTGSGPSFVVEDEASPDSSPFYIDTNGTVAIGSRLPNGGVGKLYIEQNGSGFGTYGTLVLANSSMSSTAGSEIRFQTTDVNTSYASAIRAYATVGGATDGGSLQFLTNDTSSTLTSRMTINSSGNVGIGTTNPQSKLHVTGVGWDGSAAAFGNGISTNSLLIIPTATVQTITTDYGAGGVETPLALGTWTYKANQLYLATTGNVGIGTTSPANLLSVHASVNDVFASRIYNGGGNGMGLEIEAGDGSGTGALLSVTNIGGASRFKVQEDGNVGIGTVSPQGDLDIVSATNPTVNIATAGDVSTAKTLLLQYVSSGYGRMQSYDYATGAKNLVLQDLGGNVGIGTTNPGEKLEISASSPALKISNTGANLSPTWVDVTSAGNFEISSNRNSFTGAIGVAANKGGIIGITGGASGGDFAYYGVVSDGGSGTTVSERMRITNAGNVGIGTTSPGALLDVYNGNIRIDGEDKKLIGVNSNNFIQFGSGYTRINSPSLVSFYVDGTTEAIRVASGGNVGIGTTTPANNLDLYTASATTTISLTKKGCVEVEDNAVPGTYGRMYFSNGVWVSEAGRCK